MSISSIPERQGSRYSMATSVGVGSCVRGHGGMTRTLTRLLGSGGEGSVYLTDRGDVCKIYSPRRIATGAACRAKLEAMVKRPITDARLCWPTEIVSDTSGAFVGFAMKRGEGIPLRQAVFCPPILRERFPRWTRIELAGLALEILGAIGRLHAGGVLLGDVNPMNILVTEAGSVSFVDCDSFQVGEFLCPVGMPPFIAAELVGKDLKTTKRTVVHESFAVSTLLFMILMPGKPPYSHAGGRDPSENVCEAHFPYPLGERAGAGVPLGPWRYVWSHFPRYLKDAFDRVFTRGERPSSADWITLLIRYREDLDRGFASSDVFPQSLRQLTREEARRIGAAWVRCASCGAEFGDRRSRGVGDALCIKCRELRIRRCCGLCGSEFALSINRANELGGRTPLCDACRQRVTRRFCRDCRDEFDIRGPEEGYFRAKGLTLPVRCQSCRAKRRAERASASSMTAW